MRFRDLAMTGTFPVAITRTTRFLEPYFGHSVRDCEWQRLQAVAVEFFGELASASKQPEQADSV